MDHSGSSSDSFLDTEGIRDEVSRDQACAGEAVGTAMREKQKTKRTMARQLRTSLENVSVRLDTITRAARVLAKRIIIQIADQRGRRA